MHIGRRLVPLTFAVLALLGVTSCADAGDANGGQPPTLQEAGAQVRATLTQLAEDVARRDLDAIVDHFAEDYASREATGKHAVRQWWTRVLDSGLADQLTLNLETATLHVEANHADVTYYDQRGELACPNLAEPCTTPQPYMDFHLERHDTTWLIIGIPSESQ